MGVCEGATVQEGRPAKGTVAAASTPLAKKPNVTRKMVLAQNDFAECMALSFKKIVME